MNIDKLLMEIKDSMRIKHSALDGDIKRNIKAAIQDMRMRGVSIPDKWDSDSLVYKACELYCKGQYDHLGEGERFIKSYESLRDSMSLSGDYNGKE